MAAGRSAGTEDRPGESPCESETKGADRAWWLDWSSKPACPARTRVGGFDSHTLPPSPGHPAWPQGHAGCPLLPQSNPGPPRTKPVNPGGPFMVILNPAASGGRGGRLLPRVREELERRKVPHLLRVTDAPGHARELVSEAVAAGSPGILVVGGDGTVHEVANGVLELQKTPPPLAVLPVGTGNDFFRMVSPARDLPGAVEPLLAGKVSHFEVGRAGFDGGSRHFVNLLGVGLDVEVLRRRPEFRRLSGLPQYLAALTAAVVSFSPVPLRIQLLDSGEPIRTFRSFMLRRSRSSDSPGRTGSPSSSSWTGN